MTDAEDPIVNAKPGTFLAKVIQVIKDQGITLARDTKEWEEEPGQFTSINAGYSSEHNNILYAFCGGKVDDDLTIALCLAHEVGHHFDDKAHPGKYATNVRKRQRAMMDMMLHAFDRDRMAFLKDSLRCVRAQMPCEIGAWQQTKPLLEKMGFADWKAYEVHRREALKSYIVHYLDVRREYWALRKAKEGTNASDETRSRRTG